MATHNMMVGYPLMPNSDATLVNLVQSILPTRMFSCASDCPTCLKMGSSFLQWPHQGA